MNYNLSIYHESCPVTSANKEKIAGKKLRSGGSAFSVHGSTNEQPSTFSSRSVWASLRNSSEKYVSGRQEI